MTKKAELMKEAVKELEQIRMKQIKKHRSKQEEIHAKYPDLQGIERKIALCSVRKAKSLLIKDPEEKVSILKELEEQYEMLLMEQNRLKKEYGYEEKDFEMEYVCAECRDEGYVGTERCKCLQKRYIHKLYEQSNLNQHLLKGNLNNFNINLYTKEKKAGENKSPYELAEQHFKTANDFIDYFRDLKTGNIKESNKGAEIQKENLLIMGSTGLGKTFLCYCIAGELLEQGYFVLYLTASQLFDELAKERFHKQNEDEELEWKYSEILEADILIIDDLGTEEPNTFTVAELYRILNDRLVQKKPIIISTNLNQKELHHLYSDRILSRMLGEFIRMGFLGEDNRTSGKEKKKEE